MSKCHIRGIERNIKMGNLKEKEKGYFPWKEGVLRFKKYGSQFFVHRQVLSPENHL